MVETCNLPRVGEGVQGGRRRQWPVMKVCRQRQPLAKVRRSVAEEEGQGGGLYGALRTSKRS